MQGNLNFSPNMCLTFSKVTKSSLPKGSGLSCGSSESYGIAIIMMYQQLTGSIHNLRTFI